MKNKSALRITFIGLFTAFCCCTDIFNKKDNTTVDEPPPAPIGLTAVYDTANGCVLLTWQAVSVSDLAGYTVYRDDASSSNQQQLNDSLLTGTQFKDTLFKNPSDTAERIVSYRIQTKDKAGKVSEALSDPVTLIAPPPKILQTSMTCKTLNLSGDSARIFDTVLVAARFQNIGRKIVELRWYVGSKDSPVKTVHDTANTGGDTIALSWSDTALKRIYVAVTDWSSKTWWDSASVHILRDLPVVNAGKDTGVWVNDTIRVRGSQSQQFGSVAKWEWKFGPGAWTICGRPDTFCMAPSIDTVFVCSLAVTDNAGNRVMAEKRVTVYRHLLSIATGWDHIVLLKTDSTVWTCGRNHDGQLGDGTNTDRLLPAKVFSGARAVYAGSFQTFFIKADNTLWVCGLSQLGNGSTFGGPTPIAITSNVRSVAVGSSHSVVLKTDGSVWTCGDNSHYQLGFASKLSVTTLTHIMDSVQSIASGFNHCLALKTDGRLMAWGQNWYGQCGTGRNAETAIYPIQVLTGVKAVSAGANHSLALKADGTLWGCGYNEQGQLGSGTTKDTSLFIQVAAEVLSVTGGVNNTFFQKTDGSLWGCGYNTSGQLGDATASNQPSPVRLMNDVKDYAPAYTHCLFLKTDGSLWACGVNAYGQFGDSTVAARPVPGRIMPLLR